LKIKKGDSVRVKPGVLDPDYDHDLSGWQGRVLDIETDGGTLIEIAWDSVTLNRMPAEIIEACIEDGFDYYSMWLGKNDVNLTGPRDSQQDVKKSIDTINEKYEYTSSDEQNKKFEKILDIWDLWVSEENHNRFLDYLAEHIKTPCVLTGAENFSWEEPYLLGIFDQTEYEKLKKERPSSADQFKLIRLEGIDDRWGILVKVRRISDKKIFIIPLWELKTADKKDRNHPFIDAYSNWMSNYS
jgi:hypothetical protein